jgi:hypothetical protein
MSDITEQIQFDLEARTPKLLTVAELEKALQEEQEIADQLLKNAEDRKRAIKKQIAEAKAEAKKEDLHKLTEIVRNLRFQYGQDFITIVKKELAKKVVRNPRKGTTEAEEWEKFQHLKNRGYYSIGNDTFGIKGNKITASIPAQKTFSPYFTMNPNKYAKMFKEFKEKEENL